MKYERLQWCSFMHTNNIPSRPLNKCLWNCFFFQRSTRFIRLDWFSWSVPIRALVWRGDKKCITGDGKVGKASFAVTTLWVIDNELWVWTIQAYERNIPALEISSFSFQKQVFRFGSDLILDGWNALLVTNLTIGWFDGQFFLFRKYPAVFVSTFSVVKSLLER